MTINDDVRDALVTLLEQTCDLPACEVNQITDIAARALGAESARLLIADYGLTLLQELGEDGPTGPRQAIDGTLAGRAFVRDEIVASVDSPLVWIPLTEGSERLGVLELTHPAWTQDRAAVDPIVRILVLVLISKRRYTDVVHRSRRAQPLSPAAEMQWDLLPPLSCSTDRVSVSGIVEPAYEIGGDSFDYAVNVDRLELAIIDAVGHGLAAVTMAVAAINSLRNARREGAGLEAAYHATGDILEQQFGHSYFVTGQLASLAIDTGTLTWLNAGHPPPLLVREGVFIRELVCTPSMPMGLGGQVLEVAIEKLQPGDRVLFHTDGVSETRSPQGEAFGISRLADHLVRATLDQTFAAETVRRLAASVMTYNGSVLADDATLFLLEYHGSPADPATPEATD